MNKTELTQSEAKKTASNLVQVLERKGQVKCYKPAELAVLHDALCFMLYELGTPFEDIPGKYGKYTRDEESSRPGKPNKRNKNNDVDDDYDE